MKSKTLTVWLAFLGGPFGLHRFYLRGLRDALGWALLVPTALGAYGVWRMWNLGQDDVASWILIPLVGFTVSACCLTGIFYGLMTPQAWNARFNPGADPESPAGRTRWATIWAIGLSLAFGAVVLMASIAISFQAYFNNQVEAGRQISE